MLYAPAGPYEKRYYYPAEVAEYFQKKARDLDGAIRVLTGMSLSRFMTLYRLRQVQEYLCCTSLTAIEISSRCGYPNSSTMGYLFRKEFGMTPGMYRQAHRPRNYNYDFMPLYFILCILIHLHFFRQYINYPRNVVTLQP